MTPERFRLVVSYVLLIGVSIAAVLIALGFLGALVVGWQGSLLGGTPSSGRLTDFGQLPAGLAALRPVAVTQLGLLVLLATPVMRVATSVVGFALERDRLYTLITLIVLGILLASIFFLR